MTSTEIEEMLKETGIPFRHHHFTQKEMKDIPLPIIVWNVPGTDNFFADGRVYKKIKNLDIELYTDDKDWVMEEKLERILMALPGSRRLLTGFRQKLCGNPCMKWRFKK